MRPLIPLFYCSLIVGILPFFSSAGQAAVRDPYTKAMELYRDGQYGAAKQTLQVARGQSKQDAGFHTLAGAIAAARLEWDDAEKAFREAVRIEPDESSYRLNLAEVLYSRGNYLDAAGHYAAANQEDANERGRVLATYKELLCRLLLQQNEKAKAILSALKPTNAHPLYYYGHAVNAFAVGKAEEGRYFVSSARLLFPDADNRAFLASIIEQGWMLESEIKLRLK